MTNTKNWKDIYEEYKAAVAENNDEDLRNKQLSAMKNLRDEQNHIWDGCFDRLTIGHLRWENTLATFLYADVRKWDCSFMFGFDTLAEIGRGNVEKSRDLLSRKLVKQFGAWIMNSNEKFSVADVHRILADIEDSVRLIDSEFCADVKARLEKESSLTAGINTLSDMMTEIEYRPNRLWNKMVKAWADQELLKVGNKVGLYGIIAKVTEKTILFNDGCRKNIESIDYGRFFRQEHPEIERKH